MPTCQGVHISWFFFARQTRKSMRALDEKHKWKSLRLDLLEVDRMTALIHYERQRWKKVNFFAKKPLPRSFFQHVQTLCMPSFIDMHTHATPGHVTSFACSRNTSDRSLAWSRHRRSTRAIDRDRGGETWNTSGKPHAVACCTCCCRSTASTGSRSTGMQLAQALFSDSWRSSTGHDRSQCTTTKDRSRKKEVMEALWSFLLDRLDVEQSILRFPRPLHASEVALRILAKGNWKIESFLWGGRFGRSLLCPGRAEKKTRGSWPTTGCLPVDRNKLGPDSWRDEKGVWYRTHTQTHTQTHTHTELKPCGPPGPRR